MDFAIHGFDKLSHDLFPLQLLGQNGDGQIARLHSLHYSELQYFHDLFHRRSGLQSVVNVPRGVYNEFAYDDQHV